MYTTRYKVTWHVSRGVRDVFIVTSPSKNSSTVLQYFCLVSLSVPALFSVILRDTFLNNNGSRGLFSALTIGSVFEKSITKHTTPSIVDCDHVEPFVNCSDWEYAGKVHWFFKLYSAVRNLVKSSYLFSLRLYGPCQNAIFLFWGPFA